MTNPITAKAIAAVLFELDPMSTCCKENNCRDEYDRIALGITSKMKAGRTMEFALQDQFNFWFEFNLDEHTISRLTHEIRKS